MHIPNLKMSLSKKNIRIRQESIMRHRRKSNAKSKSRRRYSRRNKLTIPKYHGRRNPYVAPYVTIDLKKDFRIIDNPSEVVDQFNKILSCRKRQERSIRLDLNLRGVCHFDLGALTCLLSTLRFTTNYRGNHPDDKNCREFFEKSGFLTLMHDINGHQFATPNTNNLMFEKGTDKTSNAKVGGEIKRAIKYLTGEEGKFQPVYSIIQEICPNSIEHANSDTRKVNWMMGIQYDDGKVCFALADKGYGILRTIKKTMTQKVRDQFRNDIEILCAAFDKEYQSQTDDDNRNKGLPRIKSVADAGYIQNLTVITNNTLLNLSDVSKSRMLGVNFGGTFYYWEITKETYNRWKTRKQSISA